MNAHQEDQIEHSILARVSEIRRLADCLITELQRQGSRCGFATKDDLEHEIKQLEHKIMSAITEFRTADKAWKARLKEAFIKIVARIDRLKTRINFLETNPGPISDEDQAELTLAVTEIQQTTEEAEALSEIIDEAPAAPEA